MAIVPRRRGELMVGEQKQQVCFTWHTQNRARLGAQLLLEKRKGRKQKEREEQDDQNSALFYKCI